MTNIPNPLILVKRNTFSLNGWIKFHSKKFSLQKKTQRFFHRVVKFEEKKKKTRGSCFPRTSGKGGDLSQVWLREISWCVEGKPSINERLSKAISSRRGLSNKDCKPEGREDFLSYSFALSHTSVRLIRARNRRRRRRRPPRVSAILPFVSSKPRIAAFFEDSSAPLVRAGTIRAIDKSKSLRHCAVCGRQLRRLLLPS